MEAYGNNPRCYSETDNCRQTHGNWEVVLAAGGIPGKVSEVGKG